MVAPSAFTAFAVEINCSSDSTLQGPAILDQFDTTTMICRGQTARVDEWKNVIITEAAP